MLLLLRPERSMKSSGLRLPIAVLSISLAFAARIPSQAQSSASAPPDAPYRNTSLPVDQRVADLLHRMSLEEKATMLAGSGWMESAPIQRLGIPAIKMAVGFLGVCFWL